MGKFSLLGVTVRCSSLPCFPLQRRDEAHGARTGSFRESFSLWPLGYCHFAISFVHLTQQLPTTSFIHTPCNHPPIHHSRLCLKVGHILPTIWIVSGNRRINPWNMGYPMFIHQAAPPHPPTYSRRSPPSAAPSRSLTRPQSAPRSAGVAAAPAGPTGAPRASAAATTWTELDG